MIRDAESARTPLAENLTKALALVLVVILIIIGLAGLVLPIIPGILFLVLAAQLLAKVSSRFGRYLDK